jgi:hypothetical protein
VCLRLRLVAAVREVHSAHALQFSDEESKNKSAIAGTFIGGLYLPPVQ